MRSHCARDLSHYYREKRQSLSPEMWPHNLPDLNPVEYSIWYILQERVYRLQIHDVKELKERISAEGVEAVGPVHHRDSNCDCVAA